MVPFRELLGRTGFYGEADGGAVFGIFYFAWVIPYMAIVWVLGLYFLRFFLYLAATVRFRFLMAATFYLGGAIGLELVGGRCAELHGFDNWTYITITTAEETLEMMGLIVFIRALMKCCADNYQEVRFRFS